MNLLSQLGVKYKRTILIAAVFLTLITGILASQTLAQLQLARFVAPGSTSVAVADRLAASGSGASNLTVVVEADTDIRNPAVAQAAAAVEEHLAATVGVDGVYSYWSTGGWSALKSRDNSTALIMARMTGSATQSRQLLAELSPAISGDKGAITVSVGGREEVFREVAQQARTDFGLAEIIILPGVFLLLLLVLRRWVPALMIMGLGIFVVLGSMAVLSVVARFTNVSTFAANLVLIMGIALGVDFGLFVIYRYREARALGLEQNQATIMAVRKAGHTVVISASAVAAALAALFIFPYYFLQSFAIAGLSIVAVALIAALIMLPAMLAQWGNWVDREHHVKQQGFYARLSQIVMRRPLAWLAAGVVAVALLGLPGLGMNPGPPDERILPTTAASRVAQEKIRENFELEVADMISIIPADPQVQWSDQERAAYQSRLAQVPGVGEIITDGTNNAEVVIIPTVTVLAEQPYDFVAQLRAVPAPTAALVGGYPAELSDYRDLLLDRLPVVVIVMLVLSTIILIIATRTIVLPLKAAVLNMLSLSVLAGVVVWVFQDGHLADLLGFSPTGSIDLSIPILMMCIAFGLSMDYEVLILGRILEERRNGASLEKSVSTGIQRSAPLVTIASTILAASFLVYLSSSLAYLKMLGLGMALVVLVDATIIRMILLPAAIKLMGQANWWWPRARFLPHQR